MRIILALSFCLLVVACAPLTPQQECMKKGTYYGDPRNVTKMDMSESNRDTLGNYSECMIQYAARVHRMTVCDDLRTGANQFVDVYPADDDMHTTMQGDAAQWYSKCMTNLSWIPPEDDGWDDG